MSKDVRYEIKMVGQAAAYHRLRMFMRMDRSGLRELYPPRIVQSIYFDTLMGKALEENLAGISHREKIRFRWYGPAQDRAQGILERKVRENMLGWKDLLPIDEEIELEGTRRSDFATKIYSHLTPEWNDVRATQLIPVQWIRYAREYYNAGNVRVTIDRKLSTWDQRPRQTLSTRCQNPTPDVLIVEAKCGKEHYDELQELVGRFPMFADKCSKFVYASLPGEGSHPSFLQI